MKFENTEVWGFKHAIRGMRNPLESWEKSDSGFFNGKEGEGWATGIPGFIGAVDLSLMQKLISAGSEHRKFMRQIMVSVDITAPLYWWKEFDTYKVGTVADSTSTMHKLTSKPITMDCFEMGDFKDLWIENEIGAYHLKDKWEETIYDLETLRKLYNATKDIRYWKELIRLLPESWIQTRTVTMNYENVFNMVYQRMNHKLTEWSEDFIAWAKKLPYAEELIFMAIETRGNDAT